MTIKVIIADDHPIVRLGIRLMLKDRLNVEIVGEASDSSELIAQLGKMPCDVIITDYSMPGGSYKDGLYLISYIRRYYPDVKVVVLTMLENLAILRSMLKLGVHSILSKSDDQERIAEAVTVVADGSHYVPATLAARLNQASSDESWGGEAPLLSAREVEVVRLFVSGMTITEIAARLNRSIKTVSSQKNNAMRKLGIGRDVDLYKYATRSGIG
ncbi:LuxR family transcriptional regulator [Pandoraea thiooxydans]|uniref:LuxR family transcriptional regulator n=1 Tax=Pandoraea thiooxydans TaxID=445709 RepID=A0A0G3EJ18_9BURK|nr:response regulator transcription factor [Pandoraea thiooxydans]AKJ67013.1 hypothetical protein ABW99_00965 [Pandoraea thiooxydans]APR93927.1 LuxR family transcriptional regulator [Pandoraea thiooxydans]